MKTNSNSKSGQHTKEDDANKMAVMPVQKLMLTTGIPMILSMMMQALYNIVDSAFVGAMKDTGEQALNALTLAFPVQMLMVAISIGTGVGMGALLSKNLGQGDAKKAAKAAGNGIFLAFIIYAVFLLFGIFGIDFYIGTQTQNPVIAEMATTYLRICCIVSFGIVFYSIFEKLLQGTGRSLYSTIAQITGALTNIVLDPIMIFGWLGLPEMGVAGAAWATVIGQLVSFGLDALFHFTKNKEIALHMSDLKPSGSIIKRIYLIGFPAIIAQALMSFMTYGLNIILGAINESAVTAYGLYYKVQQFILFAAFGLRDAITPIVSFAHGMQSKKRIKDGVKYGLIYTLIIMVFGTLLLELAAGAFASLFGLTGQTRDMCISAMRVISISFVFAGANVAFQGIFQALESGMESLIISVCRQFLFVIPVAWAFSLPVRSNPDMIWLVWCTFIIAEFVSCALSVIFMVRINKKKIKTIREV